MQQLFFSMYGIYVHAFKKNGVKNNAAQNSHGGNGLNGAISATNELYSDQLFYVTILCRSIKSALKRQ